MRRVWLLYTVQYALLPDEPFWVLGCRCLSLSGNITATSTTASGDSSLLLLLVRVLAIGIVAVATILSLLLLLHPWSYRWHDVVLPLFMSGAVLQESKRRAAARMGAHKRLKHAATDGSTPTTCITAAFVAWATSNLFCLRCCCCCCIVITRIASCSCSSFCPAMAMAMSTATTIDALDAVSYHVMLSILFGVIIIVHHRPQEAVRTPLLRLHQLRLLHSLHYSTVMEAVWRSKSFVYISSDEGRWLCTQQCTLCRNPSPIIIIIICALRLPSFSRSRLLLLLLLPPPPLRPLLLSRHPLCVVQGHALDQSIVLLASRCTTVLRSCPYLCRDLSPADGIVARTCRYPMLLHQAL
jgi:hypothetical protein